MRLSQQVWNAADGWQRIGNGDGNDVTDPQLVMYFAGPGVVSESACFADLKKQFPNAHMIGCTTGGEIVNEDVLDDSIVATAIQFEKTRVKISSAEAKKSEDSFACGQSIGRDLLADDLATIFVLSDGIFVNGSELVRGITEIVGSDVPVTGGMAGDGDRFETTLVGVDTAPVEGLIAAFGLYGDSLVIGHGSVGGWDTFGPERVITRSKDNVLYELDGEPALELYKRYLGEEAQNLPASALLFPLKVHPTGAPDKDVVRTILGVDEGSQSMNFAGNVPQGYTAQLMRGNFDHLIDGAARAARAAAANAAQNDKLAVMISCVGRKLLMGQRIGEEIEAAGEAVGNGTVTTGFYSYGEISPHAESGVSDLHNQTMTVTVYSEVA